MKKIMIIIDTSRASGRKFLAGAERYISSTTDWQVYVQSGHYLRNTPLGSELSMPIKKMDGLLIRDAIDTVRIMNLKIPKVINDTFREIIPHASSIVTDSIMIGRFAAEYFLGLGYTNFGFCGFREFPWSKKRFEGYKDFLSQRNIDNIYYFENELIKQHQSVTGRWKISEWLKQLPTPVCVFACNDDRAISVLEACKIAGLSVPEEVAVLGVDNDELVCNLSSPSLSSIELDFERVGFAAAEHLDELINKKAKDRVINVPPIEIVERRSTDILAIDDEEVVAALIYIKNNFRSPIRAADVVNATCISRRELERRFKKYLKRTIKSEIERLRVEMIKNRLLKSNLSIFQIANELEFTDPEHFSRYFKNATGTSPDGIQKKHRNH